MASAAILAGGLATRFGGRDKGGLVVDGRTIRDRQLETLSAVCDDVMIVGGDRPAGEYGTRRVTDIVARSGPMGGVHAALTAARHDAVFVVACDMPHVTAPLVAYFVELSAVADLVLPRTEQGYHPLCAVYRRACIQPIARRLARRELKMAALVSDVRIRVVAPEELDRFGDHLRLLANVNTPAEYAGLEALQGHKS
jgi:molybdopterin-guanine dinucleotide biosynthesis protein A